MLAVPTTLAGTPTAVAALGHRFAHHRAGADDGVRAYIDAVEHLGARSKPGAVADRDAGRLPLLREHGPRGVAEIVVTADQIAVRGDQRVAADAHAARGKNLAVESDVGAFAQLDVAVLARQNRISPDEGAAVDPNPGVRFTLGIDEAVVVDDDVVADADLVRMPKHDVLAEDDIPSACAQQQRIQRFSQCQPERTGHRLRQQYHELRTR